METKATPRPERQRHLETGAYQYLPATFAVALCLLPLLFTPALPSVDFYAHVVRYNALAHPDAAITRENYVPDWQLLPNLGMDVLGVGIMKLFPAMLSAKLLTAAMILAPVIGTISLSKALYGRFNLLNVSLAGLLGYNLVLFWGFANFLLALGIALWSLGWWIAARERPILRFWIMAAIGIVIILCHGLVFALWGLLLASIELMLAIEERDTAPAALMQRAARLLALAIVPILLFAQMSTSDPSDGLTESFSNLAGYAREGALWTRIFEEVLKRVDSFLRVVEISAAPWNSPWLDRGFGIVLWALIGYAALRRWFTLHRTLLVAAGIAVLLVGLMPPNLLGAAHLDERMPLVLFALLAAGLRLPENLVAVSAATKLRSAVIALFPVHVFLSCMAMAAVGKDYRSFIEQLRPLDTGEIATSVFFNGTYQRDAGMFCKPLLYLLQIEKGTAAPTFSIPTQQPIRIVGDLAAALSASRAIPPDASPNELVISLLDAGYHTIVACDVGPPALEIDGVKVDARGERWAIYRRE